MLYLFKFACLVPLHVPNIYSRELMGNLKMKLLYICRKKTMMFLRSHEKLVVFNSSSSRSMVSSKDDASMMFNPTD